MPAVLVVGRETSRMRTLRDLSVNDLLQGVDALGRVHRVGNVHQMHFDGDCVWRTAVKTWCWRVVIGNAGELREFRDGIFADHRSWRSWLSIPALVGLASGQSAKAI